MGNTSSLWKGGSDALVDVCRSAHFERVDFSGFKAPSAVLAASRRGPRNGSIESLRSNTNATFSGNSSRPKISTTERFLARADVHDRGARPHAPQRGRRVIILISDDVATYPGGHGTHDIITELIASDAVLYNLKIPGYNPPGTMLLAAMEKGLVNLRAVMDQTGGEVFSVQDVSHLDETFRALIERIKTRYTLEYYTKASAAEGKPHKLDVRLAASFGKKGRDYVVLSKNGFYVH